MKKFIATLALLSLTATTVRAEDEKLPDVVLIPLEQGEKAPTSGVLIPPEGVASIVSRFELFDEKLRLELDKLARDDQIKLDMIRRESEIRLASEKKAFDLQLASTRKEVSNLLDRNQKLEKSRRSAVTWGITGMIIGVLVTGLGAFGVARITK
jgi:hypothetical protein